MRHILMAGLVIALSCGMAKAEDLVGSLASPDRLVFHGCKLVKESEIRRALEGDWQVQLAAAPSMPLNAYLYTLQKRLHEGFLASGFSQPKVSAELEGGADGHVVVTVDEGPRYFCGGIRVTGKTGAIPVRRLIQGLTSETPFGTFASSFKDAHTYLLGTKLTESRSYADWTIGDTAPFGADMQDILNSDVRDTLANLGYFTVRQKVGVEITAGGKAELHIDILDPGKPTLLDHVEVVGNKISKTSDIQKLIGLVPGQSIGLDDLFEAQRRLWESARFFKHFLTATSSPDGKWARLILKADVGEVSGLPPLDQPLSDADQALLRCRKWFLNGLQTGDDLVVDLRLLKKTGWPRTSATFIVGSLGAAFHVRQEAAATRPADVKNSNTIEYAGAISPQMAGVFAISDQRKILIDSPNQVSWVLYFHVEQGDDEADKSDWKINFGGGRETGPDIEPGVRLSMRIPPAALLEAAHAKDVRTRVEGGKLLIDGGEIHMSADAASGRFEKIWAGNDKGDGIEFARRQGALAQETAVLAKAGTGTNQYDSRHPFASLMAFIADEALRGPWLRPGSATPENRGKLIISKLLSLDVFEPFDRLSDSFAVGDSTFLIPPPRAQSGGGFVASVAMFAFAHTNDLFEHGSWPWTLSRQILLMFAQHPESFEPELKRIVSDDRMGPVGFLAAAKFLQPYSPQTSTALAGIGLGQLDAQHFQVDIDAWTTGNSIVPQSLRRVAQRLRELSDVDMDALATMVPPEVAKVLRQFRTALRAHANEAIEKALPEVLQLLWADSYQNMVGTALHQIADAH